MDSDNKTYKILKDVLNVVVFVVLVAVGVMLINAFVFRSFNVEGPSMEKTMYTGDKLIVNKIPVTFANIQGKKYMPERGQVIVFKNPELSLGVIGKDEYIVKRVVGFPGETVYVNNGKVTVVNSTHPEGFDPDNLTKDIEGSPTSGDVITKVPAGEIFVMGDHRQGNYSLDSRSGLGTIPQEDIVGPVGLKLFPFQEFRFF
ncbi:MAG: signal peptidase I [Candidatus Saccharibacteria bacterium]|nr:signal peptidase I [Candidatus Saccharibacteria bacterium]